MPVRKFRLMIEQSHMAIWCDEECGPSFGGVCVSDHCNTKPEGSALLGEGYTNDTGLAGRTVFTGSVTFTAEEIEMFEVTE
jgi:hypothetical protein